MSPGPAPVGPPLLALVGPTASGKTEASIPLACALGAEIVCVDSMLVYRGMDVGTAKPEPELQARVPHHLLDVVDPDESFSVTRFQALANHAINEIHGRGNRALLVGGGSLYYRAVVDELEFPRAEEGVRNLLRAEGVTIGPHLLHQRLASFDPSAAARIDPRNLRRTLRALEVAAITGERFSSFASAWGRYPAKVVRAAGIQMPRPVLHERIERRVHDMMPGLLTETARLVELGFARLLTSLQAIGYAEAVLSVRGAISTEEATARTIRRTKGLARHQMAWFRRDPRITWFPVEGSAREAVPAIIRYLRGTVPAGTVSTLARVEA